MSSSRASIAFIFITILLDVIGLGLIIPVMPDIVAKFTTSNVETNNWLMVMTAGYGLMQFFFSPILGALSDKFGRRPIILISIVGLGLDFILQGIAWSIPVLFAARLLGGITGASFSVGSAYIADITKAEDRAKGFGMIGVAFGLGFILGPVLGGVLGNESIELPFFVAAGFSLLNALYGFFVLPESLSKELRTPFSFKNANAFSALKGLAELKGLKLFIAAIGLTTLAQFTVHAVWIRYTETRFLWTPRENGLSLFAVGIATAIVQGGLLGILVKKWGEEKTAKIGLFFCALEPLLFGVSPQGFWFYIVLVICILAAAAAPAMQAQVSRAVAADKQGIAMGALSSLTSITQVLAPFIGLTLLSKFTHAPGALQTLQAGAPFFGAAAIQLVGLTLAMIYFSRLGATPSTSRL